MQARKPRATTPTAASTPPAPWRWAAAFALSLLVAACGGGGGGGGEDGADGKASALSVPASRQEAARFLNQATFGVTEADLDRVMAVGYARWIDEQMALPQTLHRDYWDAENLAIKAANANSGAGTREVLDTFYRQAVTGPDQLRQRVAFALSQIFVVSMMDGAVSENPRGVAGYLDMLGTQAFGRYRDLLEQVARHPVMGAYLSHLKNQKEDLKTGRVPDQNFAREVMQLFSIGLVQLGLDGTSTGTATYSGDDVAGLAKVFTGWSWDGPDTADGRFWGWDGNLRDPQREWQPMQGYSQFHSLSEKRFLGQTVGAQGKADPDASLKVALDTLAGHANVGPFIGRQLIQRLVKSHPSPAYVARVAAAFNDNGSGVRGDMKAVVRAVLLDAEARGQDASAGKLREPVLRLTALLRALGATSDSGKWLIGTTDDPGTSLGQSPLRSPSVFNFYRPGYVPPGSEAGKLGLTVPELQITHETSVAGYANYLRDGVQNGFGQRGTNWQAPRNDVRMPLDAEVQLADQPQALVDRVTARLLPGAATEALKAEIQGAVESVALPALKADSSNQNQVNTARRNRALLAVYLAAVSPEFLLQ